MKIKSALYSGIVALTLSSGLAVDSSMAAEGAGFPEPFPSEYRGVEDVSLVYSGNVWPIDRNFSNFETTSQNQTGRSPWNVRSQIGFDAVTSVISTLTASAIAGGFLVWHRRAKSNGFEAYLSGVRED